MTLSEIADFVCEKVGVQDDDSVALAKSFATKRHKMIWNNHLWRDSITPMSQSVNALTIAQVGTVNPRYVVFRNHPEVDRVLAVCADDNTAYSPEELVTLFWRNPEAFSATGGSFGGFTPMRRTPLLYGPDVLEELVDFGLKAVCASLLTAVTVTLKGRDINGITTTSTASLTNNSPVNMSKVLIDVFSAETSNADWSSDAADIQLVSVDDPSFSVGNFHDDATTTPPTFPVIRIGQPITTSGTIRAIGKLSCPSFEDDDDVPLLLNIDNALLAFVEGDMLSRQRQRGKANLCYAEGAAHVKAMIDEERNQSASIMRIIPFVEGPPNQGIPSSKALF